MQAAEDLPVSKKVRQISPSGLANSSASAAQRPRPQTAQTSPTRKLAQEFRKRAPETTETYVAYGVSEALVKECAKQADYSIPQAKEKGVEIPKTQGGEDLGAGTGWWYEGDNDESTIFFSALTVDRNGSDTHLQYLGTNNIPTHVFAYRSDPLFPYGSRSDMEPAHDQPFLLPCRGAYGNSPQYPSAHGPK